MTSLLRTTQQVSEALKSSGVDCPSEIAKLDSLSETYLSVGAVMHYLTENQVELYGRLLDNESISCAQEVFHWGLDYLLEQESSEGS